MIENGYRSYSSTRGARASLSRRRFLGGTVAAGAGAAGILLAGCGDDNSKNGQPTQQNGQPSQATGTAAATNIKRGGTLRIGSTFGADLVFDPAITNHTGTYSLGLGLVFNRLMNYDGDVNVQAELAASLPEQPDEVTYIFKLRPDVRWHDLPPANGRQFTAADAVFGLSRFNEKNAEFKQGQLDRISKIEAIDNLTFRLTTKEPFAPMIRFIADDPILMVNREQREAVGDGGMKKYENLLGTGPWMRGKLVPQVSGELRPNPNYFEMGADGKPLPYMESIRHLAFSADAQEGAFIAGQFDHYDNIGAGGTFKQVKALQDRMGSDVDFRKRRHSAIEETYLHTQKPPFNDTRVRRAVHLVTNRQLTVNSYGGPESGIHMGPVPQMFYPQAFSESELLQMPGFRFAKDQDIKDAIDLMKAAGVGVGAGQTIDIPVPIQCDCQAVVIKEDVARLGLNLKLDNRGSSGDYFAERGKGNFIMNMGLEVGGTDPDTYLYHRFHTDAPFNKTRFSDGQVDRLLEKQRATLNPVERAKVIKEVSLLLIEYSPQVFTASLVFYPIFRSYVKGHPERPPFGLTHNLARLWLDK